MAETIDVEPHDEDSEGGPRKSFWDHVKDLRSILVKSVIVVVVALVVCLLFVEKIAAVLEYPITRMDLLDKPQATVSIIVGTTTLGPYQVNPKDFPGLETGKPRNLVFRMGVAKVDGKDVATLNLDPQAPQPATGIKLRNLDPAEGFMVAFNIALYASLVVSAPFWMYFIGGYILPALKKKERRFIFMWIGWGMFLFLSGVVLTYFFLLPLALRASVAYSNLLGFDASEWQAADYISFTCKFLLGMGLGFQYPIVLLTLVKLKILSHKTLVHYRRHFIVLAFILGAFLTTPEVITQFAMAVPLCILYEVCIWIAWWWERRDRKAAALTEGTA